MNKTSISKLVNLLMNEKLSYNNTGKSEFIKLGKSYMRSLAARLGYRRGEFEVRVCEGGIAVSGDVILHSDHVYVSLSQSGNGGFFFRGVKSRKDYTGHRNIWAKYEELLDLDDFARRIRGQVPGFPVMIPLPLPREAKAPTRKLAPVTGTFSDVRESLAAKIHPRRIRMDSMAHALIACLLSETWTTPSFSSICITSDGFIMGEKEGDIGYNTIICHVRDFVRNWEILRQEVPDITDEESNYMLSRVDAVTA